MASSKNQEREAREARERLKRYNARQAVHTHQAKRRKRDNLVAAAAVVVVAALAAVIQIFYFTAGPGMPLPTPSASPSASAPAGANVGDVPSPDVSEYRAWTGQLDLNDIPLTFTLDGSLAPQAVAAFVTDVQSGYYVGKSCHRLVSDGAAGLIQCGSENGDGQSDPAAYAYGPVENVPADGNYVSGTIAIANNGSAYGQGRQFFIVFNDTLLPPGTSGGYTVIGTVTLGLDQLESQIVSGGLTATDPANPTDGTPNIPTTITGVTVQ